MEETKEKKSFTTWVKEHRKELIIAGVGIAVLTISVVVLKKKATPRGSRVIEDMTKSILNKASSIEAESVTEATTTVVIGKVNETITHRKVSHDVASHLRNLPKGRCASPLKLATAAEHGFQLSPGQTWIETYTTGLTALAA